MCSEKASGYVISPRVSRARRIRIGRPRASAVVSSCSPQSLTRVGAAASGTRSTRSSPSGSPPCWPGRGRSLRSANGRATRPRPRSLTPRCHGWAQTIGTHDPSRVPGHRRGRPGPGDRRVHVVTHRHARRAAGVRDRRENGPRGPLPRRTWSPRWSTTRGPCWGRCRHVRRAMRSPNSVICLTVSPWRVSWSPRTRCTLHATSRNTSSPQAATTC